MMLSRVGLNSNHYYPWTLPCCRSWIMWSRHGFSMIYTQYTCGMYTEQWVINNEPCTNNFAEGHNHALQLAAGCSHPGIELLIETLTLYNTDAELNIQQALSGTVMVPRQKKKYAKLDEKIFNAVGYYGRVDTEMNCRTLGHLNHKRQ